MKNDNKTLTPYLHFEGNCEEVLNIYQKFWEEQWKSTTGTASRDNLLTKTVVTVEL